MSDTEDLEEINRQLKELGCDDDLDDEDLDMEELDELEEDDFDEELQRQLEKERNEEAELERQIDAQIDNLVDGLFGKKLVALLRANLIEKSKENEQIADKLDEYKLKNNEREKKAAQRRDQRLVDLEEQIVQLADEMDEEERENAYMFNVKKLEEKNYIKIKEKYNRALDDFNKLSNQFNSKISS